MRVTAVAVREADTSGTQDHRPCAVCGIRPRAGARQTWCQPCKSEYQRQYRRKKGVQPRTRRPLRERLYERTVIQANGCVLWTGATNHAGYGYLGRGGRDKNILAHVASWELLYGPVPEGLELDHLCVTPACLAPAHLEPVTHAENVRRARERMIAARGGGCPQGHAYVITARGWRRCYECARVSNARRRKSLVEV